MPSNSLHNFPIVSTFSNPILKFPLENVYLRPRSFRQHQFSTRIFRLPDSMSPTSDTDSNYEPATPDHHALDSACLHPQIMRHSRHRSEYQDWPARTRAVSTSRRGRSVSMSAALSNAFASDEEQPNLFPAAVYRTPTRSCSRSKTSPLRSSTSPTPPSRGAASRQSSEPWCFLTIDAAARNRSYSPMDAGFARLNCKDTDGDTPPTPERRGRSELAVQMFEGAA